MAEVVVATDDLVVLGGPASINLALDVGATGTRGSYIFNDIGKPNTVSFSMPPIIGDMYININPSDDEYLYLYQYKLVNGVLGWVRILRLVPNTVLFSPYFKFIDGEAYSPIVDNNNLLFVRGIFVSLAEGGLENEQIETLDARDLSVQYRVSGDAPVMSNLTIGGINTTFSVVAIPAATGTPVTQTVNLNKRYLFARLKIAEFNEATSAVELVDGYRKVDFFATVGGRSEAVLDIDAVAVASTNPADAIQVAGVTVPFPGGLIVPGHAIEVNDAITYLTNGNAAIGSLVNGREYLVVNVTGDTIVLSYDGSLVNFSSSTKTGVHSVIDLGSVKVTNV